MNNKIILYLIGVFVLAFPLHVFGAGACCNTNGSCFINNDEYDCSEGGTWQGDGTVCDPNPCPQPDTCDIQLCYNIVATDENGNTNSDSWQVCLNDDGTGSLCSDNAGTCYQLYLFGGGPGWFNTSGYPGFVNGKPKWATWIAHGTNESGFLQPIGEGGGGGDLLTGEGVHIGNTRYTVQGKKVPCLIPD